MVMKRNLIILIISLYWKKKIFKRAHQNPNANVCACPDVTFWAVGYNSPKFQLAFQIYYVKYENTLTCKRISWNPGGNDVFKIFSISYMYNTKVTI